MKGIIFLIISCLIILLAVLFIPKPGKRFWNDLLHTLLFMIIPVAGIYCTLEHITIGMRIVLGIATAIIAGFLCYLLGMEICRTFEKIVTSGRHIGYKTEKLICILCTLCGIGLSVLGVVYLKGYWLTGISYVAFVPLYFIILICSQYQYEN